MRRFAPLALLLPLLLVPRLDAGDEEARPDRVVLEGAQVVASPGCPSALREQLPEGRAPAPLTWPLPDGPLLVLGLPFEDEAAADLARAWGSLPPYDDLHGGYVIQAWVDGERPIVAVFAADGVALRAAVDRLGSPVRVRPGRTVFRPRFRTRTLAWEGRLEEGVEIAARTLANQMWIRPDRHHRRAIAQAVKRLQALGIEPVVAPDATRGQDEIIVAETAPADGRPWIYSETWCIGVETPVPCRPRGRDPSLGEAASGVVVSGRWGVEPVLRDAWSPSETQRDVWEETLLPLLPHDSENALGFRDALIQNLERAAAPSGAPTWLAHLANGLRWTEAAPTDPIVPRVPTAFHADGLLDEAGWAYARRVALGHGVGSMLLAADGQSLHVAVETPKGIVPRRVTAALPRPHGETPYAPPVARRLRERPDGTHVLEATFDREALRGDAHPGRWIRIQVHTRGGPDNRSAHTVVLGP